MTIRTRGVNSDGGPLAATIDWRAGLLAADKPNSAIHSVRIGGVTSSMPGIAPDEIIPTLVKIGISMVELNSVQAEAMAGAPAAGGGGAARGARGGEPLALNADGLLARCTNTPVLTDPPLSSANSAGRGGRGQTPEPEAAAQRLRHWRAATTPGTWQALRKRLNDAGMEVRTMFASRCIPGRADLGRGHQLRVPDGEGARRARDVGQFDAANREADRGRGREVQDAAETLASLSQVPAIAG